MADDVASAPFDEREKRRGVAGMVFAFKIAGAAADAGLDLAGVTAVAQRAADNCRTMGVALSPCTVPQAGKPTFTIAEDEMEIGMGIHGEPGVHRGKLQAGQRHRRRHAGSDPGRSLAGQGRQGRGAGQQPRRHAGGGAVHPVRPHRRPPCDEAGVAVGYTLVGRYATSMEMAGASLTLLALDDELENYLNAPAACAFWKV